jgi:polyisoprenoid-binding protein YceI
MTLRILLAVLATAAAFPAAAEDTYVLDPAHSRPTFEARHLGYTTQFGSFGAVNGKIRLDRAAKTAAVDVTIDAASVRTFDARLDAIVKGERFFNVEKFPTITFRSTGATFDGDRLTAVDGELTMLGVTKPVTLKLVSFACGEHPFSKKAMCGADAVATLKRSDWGMTTNVPTMSPADEVTIRIPVEALKEVPA